MSDPQETIRKATEYKDAVFYAQQAVCLAHGLVHVAVRLDPLSPRLDEARRLLAKVIDDLTEHFKELS